MWNMYNEHVNILQKKYNLDDFEIGLSIGFYRGTYDLNNPLKDGEHMIRIEQFIKSNIA